MKLPEKACANFFPDGGCVCCGSWSEFAISREKQHRKELEQTKMSYSMSTSRTEDQLHQVVDALCSVRFHNDFDLFDALLLTERCSPDHLRLENSMVDWAKEEAIDVLINFVNIGIGMHGDEKAEQIRKLAAAYREQFPTYAETETTNERQQRLGLTVIEGEG